MKLSGFLNNYINFQFVSSLTTISIFRIIKDRKVDIDQDIFLLGQKYLCWSGLIFLDFMTLYISIFHSVVR